jgi:prophage maintenance system killer protein
MARNGHELTADETDAVETIQALAAGRLTEEKLAHWIMKHSCKAGR